MIIKCKHLLTTRLSFETLWDLLIFQLLFPFHTSTIFPYIEVTLELPVKCVWNGKGMTRPSQRQRAGPGYGRQTARWARPCRSLWSGSALYPAGGPEDPIHPFQSPVVLLPVRWGEHENNPLWLTDRPCSLIQSPLKVSLHYLRRIHIISGWLKENFISRTPWFDLLFVILQWYRRWYRNRCGCKSQNRATLWQGQTLSFLAEFADRSHGCWFQVSKTYLSAGNQDLNLG